MTTANTNKTASSPGDNLYFKCMFNSRFSLKILTPCLVIFFLSLIMSCGQSPEKEERFFDSEVYFQDKDTEINISDLKEIFYDIYSPTEAKRVFRQINPVFDPSILNSADNIMRYSGSSKIAVNLGILGADMSFCHMFGQTQEEINYLSAIYRLADNLGISGIIGGAEYLRDESHPDSLFDKAREIYISADKQLKANDRSGIASLILAGGWIEALYITSLFYDKENPDPSLVHQIISQKYSLDRLVALLSNHHGGDINTSKYLLYFRQLKQLFDNVDIMFNQEDLKIDTVNKTIEAASPQLSYKEKDIEEIIKLVNLIRQDMVN